MMSWPAETASSSLRIVPTPVPSVMDAFAVVVTSTTLNVSSSSGVVSPLTVTSICCVVSFAAKMAVPVSPV